MEWQQYIEERRLLVSTRREWRRCRQVENECRAALKAAKTRTRTAAEKLSKVLDTIESRQGVFGFAAAGDPSPSPSAAGRH